MRKYLFYLGVLFLGAVLLTGCGTLQTLVKGDGETTSFADWIGGTDDQANVPATSSLGDGKMISLYFPDSTGQALVKEERTIPKTLSLARETVNQWLMGPAVQGETQAAVDPKTDLLDIAIKDSVAIVDLSREFTRVYGNVNQEVAIYGLVNTLTQFPTVREVTFRIEGKSLTKLGNLDVSKLSYREGLVKGGGVSNGGNSSIGSEAVGGQVQQNNLGVPKSTAPDSPSGINLFSFPVTTG